jgi:hypothetical protein
MDFIHLISLQIRSLPFLIPLKKLATQARHSQSIAFSEDAACLPLTGNPPCFVPCSIFEKRHPLGYRSNISLEPTRAVLLVQGRYTLGSTDSYLFLMLFRTPLDGPFIGIEEYCIYYY